MADEWRESTWGEEISLEYGKALRGYDPESGAYRVFGSNGPIGWHSESLTDGPGVILGRKGAYRGVQFWRDPFWVIDTAYYVVPKMELDHRWLYYAIKHYKLGEIDDGSPIPSTTRAAVYVKELQVPPLREQQAIACILGALDDKIELNRRRSRTLEAMARAIFQSWFVDFDPVKAKAAGRTPPGLSPALAALFPDSLADSPLGPIPKGWRVAILSDICEVIDCLHTKKPDRIPSGMPLLQLNNILDNGVLDLSDIYSISEADYSRWISRMEAQVGDCVITNVGRVGAVARIPKGVAAALGRNMTGLRCRRDFIFPTFLIELLLSKTMREEIRLKIDSGTILDALNVRNISKLRLARPSNEVAQEYETRVGPLRSQMEHLLSESRTLAALRDALLPKLISGELRVPDAERIVGRAV
jgi:type I restriction enzyme S subunit